MIKINKLKEDVPETNLKRLPRGLFLVTANFIFLFFYFLRALGQASSKLQN